MGSRFFKLLSVAAAVLSLAANVVTLFSPTRFPLKWLLAVAVGLLGLALVGLLLSLRYRIGVWTYWFWHRHFPPAARFSAWLLAKGKARTIEAIGELRRGDSQKAVEVMKAVARHVTASDLLATEPVPDLEAHCTMIWMLGQKPAELERNVLHLFDSGGLGSQYERVRCETAETLKTIAPEVERRRDEIRIMLWEWVARDSCQEARKKVMEAFLLYWDRRETSWLKDGFRRIWQKRTEELLEKCVELWKADISPESSCALAAVAERYPGFRARCFRILRRRSGSQGVFESTVRLVAWNNDYPLNPKETAVVVRILRKWNWKKLQKAADALELSAEARDRLSRLETHGL